jgi:hypothetical protein
MFRIKLAMAILGGVLAFVGIQEWRVSSGTTTEPIAVNLVDVEKGKVPDNSHWNLGEHVAVYDTGVYEYSQSKYDTSEPDAGTSITHYYYPVLSSEHPFLAQLRSLSEKYGSVESIPAEEVPALTDIAVIVKTKQFDTIGSIPSSWEIVPNLQGLVINRISSLSRKEAELLQGGLPGLNTEKLLILEAGRQPASTAKSLGMISGGAIVALAGVAWMFAGKQQS